MLFKDDTVFLSQCFDQLDASSTVLEGIEFDDCTFTKCDFNESTFKKCKFVDCTFEHCNLSNLNVSYSRFLNVTFEHSKVIGVDWSRADWPNIASFSALKFHQSILNYSSFFGVNLQELVMEECKAHEVDFRNGTFFNGNFSYTDFSKALFDHTHLNQVNFAEATHYDINVFNNEIKGAKFTRFEAVSLLESLDIELLD